MTYQDRQNVIGIDYLGDAIVGLLDSDIDISDETYAALTTVRDRINHRQTAWSRKPTVTLRQLDLATKFVEAHW